MMVTSRFALPIALAFSLSACATNIVAEKASRFDQGVAAYDVGDFAAAYRIWSELAREDDLAAMRNTAQLLRQGKGVDKDPKKAFDLYLEAAEKGLVTAMANVGDMYLAGEGYESEEIADFAGLASRHPWAAGAMAVFLFSLAGVPPLVGFYAKLAVLQALIATGHAGYIGLAVIAVLLSLVGAYYYLRVVKVMYFDAPTTPAPIVRGSGIGALLALNGALVFGLGLLPGGLMDLCRDAIVKALAS